ncbi:hypothetical protein FOL47_004551 [Perkinsus chesapeaki]|uniref:Protein phosphatase inhibitor 2 n=1 Tax=Perkinsus chesapeaki TaxID=330153 RepID=A0A7J6M219_PERCH|nr:hypothetical protein FOL47_004551 [Perkinsus chesapeaki]
MDDIPNATERPRRDSKVKFDEHVLAEHDKLRGTRMTINEPDTPFIKEVLHDSEEEDTPAHCEEFGDALADKLTKLNVNEDGTAARGDNENDGEKSRKAFEQKRKNHYNEFKAMKALGDGSVEVEEDDE